MATPTIQEFARANKSGVDLGTFDDVKLFKLFPKAQPVTSVQDALSRLGNDNVKLLAVLTEGLQAEAARAARESEDGWMVVDENGKDTTEQYKGTLVSTDILNPVVLNLSKINPATVLRDGKAVEITWDEAKDADEKRKVKDATFEMIKSTPKIVEGLKRKMAQSVKVAE